MPWMGDRAGKLLRRRPPNPSLETTMAPLTAGSREWLKQHHQAVLITLRADGSPQSSNVLTAFDDDDDVFRVSVTAGRVKTRNLARDPRAIVHVLGGNFWGYASVRCSAHLGSVSVEAGDQAGQELLQLFNDISEAPHPNPPEFFDVQVAEQRLLLSLSVESVSGAGWDN
jgi:PPOX class probable F420-dependent enzyme